jgi:hypothetical protein
VRPHCLEEHEHLVPATRKIVSGVKQKEARVRRTRASSQPKQAGVQQEQAIVADASTATWEVGEISCFIDMISKSRAMRSWTLRIARLVLKILAEGEQDTFLKRWLSNAL